MFNWFRSIKCNPIKDDHKVKPGKHTCVCGHYMVVFFTKEDSEKLQTLLKRK